MERQKVLVSKVNNNLEEVVEKIFNDLNVNLKGKSVLIKPNMVGPFAPPGICTHPDVVRAVVRACKKREASKIIVGDNPGGVTRGSAQIAEVTGILEASEGTFAAIGDRVEKRSLDCEYADSVIVSKVLQEVDYLINLPIFKTHVLTAISCAIKNTYGYVAGASKSQLHLKAPTRRRFSELLTEIYKIRIPDLTIVDALWVMEGNGPTHGEIRQVNKVIAGNNAVAVDAVCCRMMGLNPEELPLLVIARKKELGVIEADMIDVLGDFEVIPDFKLPSTLSQTKEQKQETLKANNDLTVTAVAFPFVVEEKCIQCGDCQVNCPAEAIDLNPFPVVNTEKCITCYCCVELCTEGAMEAPESGESPF
ncbi:MAG: DUF362 domain-containing protein [Bacillota bacterium]